jgi:hypothetical protein
MKTHACACALRALVGRAGAFLTWLAGSLPLDCCLFGSFVPCLPCARHDFTLIVLFHGRNLVRFPRVRFSDVLGRTAFWPLAFSRVLTLCVCARTPTSG